MSRIPRLAPCSAKQGVSLSLLDTLRDKMELAGMARGVRFCASFSLFHSRQLIGAAACGIRMWRDVLALRDRLSSVYRGGTESSDLLRTAMSEERSKYDNFISFTLYVKNCLLRTYSTS